jgi:hypothetical protein
MHLAGQQPSEWVRFVIEVIGAELVIDANSGSRTEEMHRARATPIVPFGIGFRQNVERVLLRQFNRRQDAEA